MSKRDFATMACVVVALFAGCDTGENNPMVDRYRAILASQQGDFEQSVAIRDSVIEKYPDYPYMWEVTYEQGMAYLENGEPEKALPYFEQTIEIDPLYNFAHLRKAECLELMGQMEESLDSSNEALELSPISIEFADLFLSRGNAYAGVGKNEAAEENWRLALKVEPELGSVLYRLAGHLLRDNRPGEALEMIERFLQLEEDNAEVTLMQSMAMARLDRNEEAIEALNRARELDQEGQLAIPDSIDEFLTPPPEVPDAPATTEVSVEPVEEVASMPELDAAIQVATDYLTKQGFDCQRAEAENFLKCQRDDRDYMVMVKLVSDSEANSFGMTDAELGSIMDRTPPAGMVIIGGTEAGSQPRVVAFTKSWRPDPSRLAPIAYRYPLPKD